MDDEGEQGQVLEFDSKKGWLSGFAHSHLLFSTPTSTPTITMTVQSVHLSNTISLHLATNQASNQSGTTVWSAGILTQFIIIYLTFLKESH